MTEDEVEAMQTAFIEHMAAVKLDFEEDRYVIRRNQEDVAEIRTMLKAHIDDEEAGIKDIKKSIETMAENNIIITDYVNKMAVGAWFMGKIKAICLWVTAVGGTIWALFEGFRYFHK